jgi:hypothetical protein
MKINRSIPFRQFAPMRRTLLRTLAFMIVGAPVLLPAQYSEIKMGEYLHYAVAAANGGVYAGIDGIGYTTIFGTPSVFDPVTAGSIFRARWASIRTAAITASPTAISHDGTVVAGYMDGVGRTELQSNTRLTG